MSTIKRIKEIEQGAYPAPYRQMDEIEVMEDLVNYCDAENEEDIIMIVRSCWYFLAVRSTGELVDLAGKLGISDMREIKEILSTHFHGKRINFDARESTSYRLVKRLKWKIVKDIPFDWDGEIFHEIEMEVT